MTLQDCIGRPIHFIFRSGHKVLRLCAIWPDCILARMVVTPKWGPYVLLSLIVLLEAGLLLLVALDYLPLWSAILLLPIFLLSGLQLVKVGFRGELLLSLDGSREASVHMNFPARGLRPNQLLAEFELLLTCAKGLGISKIKFHSPLLSSHWIEELRRSYQKSPCAKASGFSVKHEPIKGVTLQLIKIVAWCGGSHVDSIKWRNRGCNAKQVSAEL